MTMNEAFRPLLDKCVVVYLDDILIYSTDRAQHLQDIEAIFKILGENHLLTKASMCEFLQDRLDFLGHVISSDGVEIDPKKIATIQAWHAPKKLTELQRFLGFVNYVRRFVPDTAKLTAPLTGLLRKGVEYTWGEKEQATFLALKKKKMCSPPVLRIADPHRPFELVIDASNIAVGASNTVSSTVAGLRERSSANRVRVPQTSPARTQLPDTRPRDAGDRARVQCVAVLPFRSRRDIQLVVPPRDRRSNGADESNDELVDSCHVRRPDNMGAVAAADRVRIQQRHVSNDAAVPILPELRAKPNSAHDAESGQPNATRTTIR
ncbi:unnamed protein product [Closterium sp. NIES-54]